MEKKIPLFKVTMSSDAKKAVSEILTPDDKGNLYVGQGPRVEEFEEKFQELIGSSVRPLTTNSGTAALILALKTIGVKHDDIVLSTSMTCTATNQAIVQVGANIAWVDIDPHTGLMDPISLALAISKCPKKPAAIMTVDWGGTLCDYRRINQISKLEEIPVIQDAAHCLKIGQEHGDYVTWSFGPIKHLTMSDGGALLCPELQWTRGMEEDCKLNLYHRAKLLRWFGIDRNSGDSFRCKNEIYLEGSKFHANDVQASIGLSNMDLAVECIEKARKNAEFYNRELSNIHNLILPPCLPSNSWWLYSVVAPGNRDRLVNYLESNNIMASPVHARNDKHPVFYHTLKPVNLDGLEFFSNGQLSIPVGWWVTREEREYIVKKIKEFFS